ncbi:MAG: thiosulfate sulfurtransferase [Alteromonadaceae bacterium]|nr:MAG: thiosulfate sulfurtransferase [Alteromonadaceae bacterium]
MTTTDSTAGSKQSSNNSTPLLIEPKAALEHVGNPDVCIVDLSAEASFQSGHIPGAIHVSPKELMLGQPPAPGKLPPIERLEALFSRLGLTPNTHFIVCDDEGGGWAGRFIWTLDVISHRRYSCIDGGMVAWKAEQLPLEQAIQAPEATEVKIEINTDVIAEISDIEKGIADQSITVWDARSLEEYQGTKVLAAKGGHIPGAIHCEWTDLMDKNQGLRLRKDAKAMLAERGIDGTKTTITHCQSHHRSGFTYLVGKYLGFDMRGYHGSWSEWGNNPNTQVER